MRLVSEDTTPKGLAIYAKRDCSTATGTSEPGGWSTREMLTIIDGLKGLQVVGADVVEVAPIYDNPGETTVLAAAEIVQSLLTLMVQQPIDS